ncbi:MAG: terminase large subunit domain-containing protein [Terracidiphilus sp.]
MAKRLDGQSKIPAVLQMRPYQQRWIDDDTRFKCAVKSARIGYSFATAYRRVEISMRVPGRTTTVLSASKAQSVEFVETCAKLCQLMGGTAQMIANEDFVDALGRIEAIQSKITFPNGSRIIALPANPRTARGYPGDAVLDEFAHHDDSYAIFAAVFRQVALGNSLEVLSTPNGEQGKFYDIARNLGLDLGVAPAELPVKKDGWSGHWVDVHRAVAEGCPIDIEGMRRGLNDDDTWNQEFCCVFLKSTGAWLTLDLISACEDAETGARLLHLDPNAGLKIDLDPNFKQRGPLFAGIDVGRDHDATCCWLDEKLGDVMWTRGVFWLHGITFPNQFRILSPIIKMCSRAAIDKTGMGVGLYDSLNEAHPGRILGVSFAGTNDNGVRLKTDLAIRIKKRFEQARARIPYDAQIRAELLAIKRQATSTGVTFDAPRIEVDTAVARGAKKKVFAHADAFWAKALSELAGDSDTCALDIETSPVPTAYSQLKGYL